MSPELRPQLIRRYLTGLRLLSTLFLGMTGAAVGALFLLPRRESLVTSPMVITCVAIVMSLWFALTADRDARRRMESVRLAFQVHGELPRLLHEYLIAYLAVLLRLQSLTLCGVLTAVWGTGAVPAVPLILGAMILTVRAWPSERKMYLLLHRVGIRPGSATMEPP